LLACCVPNSLTRPQRSWHGSLPRAFDMLWK
jgi:hypothetical protein